MKVVFNYIKPLLILVCVTVSGQVAYASSLLPGSTELHTVNKLILQGSYIESSTADEQESLVHSAKYEGYYTLSSPGREWSSWDVMLRPWVVSSSSNELSDPFGTGGTQFEGEYIEMREFYYRKNNVLDNPAYSVTIGRQQYSGDYGIWWDDSFESVQFNWDNTSNGGFIAIGQHYHSYSYNFNGTTNDLNGSELDVAYLMGEYWIQPHSELRTGIRLFAQNDYSAPNDNADESDFTGVKMGLFASGSGFNGSLEKLDYYLDFAITEGKHQHIHSNGFVNGEVDSSGWAFLADLGYQLDNRTTDRRVSFRWGMTDSPDNQFSGNYVSSIQSDRKINVGTYSTGISGTFLDNRFTNVLFTGLTFRSELGDRNQVELMVFDIRQRNSEVPLSATIGDNYLDGDGSHVGNTFEVFYFAKSFPTAIKGRLLDVEYLVSAGYFRGGNAILNTVNDYKLSVGINLRY